jgi:hypothetical protein
MDLEKIAVLEFTGDGFTKSELQTASNRLRQELLNIGTYKAIGRARMEEILTEQKYKKIDCTSLACALEVADLIGADKIVSGNLNKGAGGVILSIEIIDVANALVSRSFSETCSKCAFIDVLNSGVMRVAKNICGQVELSSAEEKIRSIQVGGTYRIELNTGDKLEGLIEAKDDSSLIMDSKGTPYTFTGYLIKNIELIEPPKNTNAKTTPPETPVARMGTISYDNLLNLGASAGMIDVTLTIGSVFRGKVSSISQDRLNLEVEGAVVPISKDVIKEVSIVANPKNTPQPSAVETAKPALPEVPVIDTLFVINSMTDDYGKPLAPQVFFGRLQTDDAQGVSIKTFPRDRIMRIIKHTESPYEEQLKKYTQPLFCPQEMVIIDLPPGMEGKPFFKVCIDKYEFPNQPGVKPQGNVSYDEAVAVCKSRDKRICTADEWQWGCGGLENYSYPYGWQFDKKACNTLGIETIEPSGQRPGCQSKFGAVDMTGNIFEWVQGKDNQPMLMGGPLAKCQTMSPGVGGSAKPQTGFRCCKGN